MKRFTLAAAVWLLALAAIADTPGTINFPGSADTVVSLFEVSNNAATTLTASAASGDTSITVTSTSAFTSTGVISIDSEAMYYTGKTATTFTGLVRGADGTSAAAHANGRAVQGRNIARHHSVLRDTLVLIEAKIGTGSSTPVNGQFLIGNGTGSSTWRQPTFSDISGSVADAQLSSNVALLNRNSQSFTGTPQLIQAKNPNLVIEQIDGLPLNTGPTVTFRMNGFDYGSFGVIEDGPFAGDTSIDALSGDLLLTTSASNSTIALRGSKDQIDVTGTLDVGTGATAVDVANDTVTGTSTNLLAKLTGAPSKAIKAATTDTTGVVGICVSGCGNGSTTTATIATTGTASCTFDGATTAGHFVQISGTTAGDCHDSGLTTFPTTGKQIIGRVLTTNVAGGTYAVALSIEQPSPAAAADLSNGTSGSGSIVLASSPTMTTPTFSGTATGSISGNAGTASASDHSITACGANNWATALSTAWALTCSQPAASNLSNGVQGSGAVVLATSPTITTPTFSGTATGSISGNAGTASASDHSITACGAGTFVSAVSTAWALTCGAPSGGTNHNFLSATHTDTVAASPVLGDVIYGNSTPAWTKLAGNTTTTKKFLSQTGNGSISAVPAWSTLVSGDIPANAANTSGNAGTASASDHSITACGANNWATALSTVWALTCSQPAASNLSNGVQGSGAVVLATSPTITTPTISGALGGNLDFGTASALAVEIANDTTTGTGTNLLAKLSGAPSRAIKAATTDTQGIAGICVSGCTTSGNAVIATAGTAGCVFDASTAAGDFVVISVVTAGDCHDGGPTFPKSGNQIIGRVLSTNAVAGTYNITLHIEQPASVAAADLSNGTTGSGSIVLASSPTITTPTFSGTATGSVTGNAGTASASDHSITACGANNWATALSTAWALTCSQPAASNLSNGVQGSGAVVLDTSPTVTTPAISGQLSVTGAVYGTILLRGNGSSLVPTKLNLANSAGTIQWQMATNTLLGGGIEFNEGDAVNNRFYIAPGGNVSMGGTLSVTGGMTGNASTASASDHTITSCGAGTFVSGLSTAWALTCGTPSGGTDHNFLSATHSDTVAAAPVLGDVIYGNSTPAWTKLAGNTTTTKEFLSQTGNGTISAVPAWSTLASGDLSDGTTGSGTVVLAVAPVLNNPTIGIAGTAASSHLKTVGTAPTCSVTGFGTSPTCAFTANSTDFAGTIDVTSGSGSPGSSGTISLTFNSAYTNVPVIVLTLVGSGWGVSAVIRITTESGTTTSFSWSNQSATALVALTAATHYKVNYIAVQR